MTITKFEKNEETTTNSPKKLVPSPRKSLHIKRKKTTFNQKKTIYCFENFDDFCNFCTLIQKSSYKKEIAELSKKSILYEYNNSYYLIFTNIDLASNVIKFICPNITEFAHFVNNSELFERKIIEYGKPIIKTNAITTRYRIFCIKQTPNC